MINYSDKEGNELKTETQRVDSKIYRDRISFKSKSSNATSKEALKLHANFLTKGNSIKNREIILSEGMNSIMVYVHQVDPDDKYSADMSYMDLSYCTNSNPTGKHYSANCGKTEMTDDAIKSPWEKIIKAKDIPLSSEELSELLQIPSNFSEKVSEEKSEELYKHYKKLVSKLVEEIKQVDRNTQAKSTDDGEER